MQTQQNVDDDWDRFNILWRRDFCYGFHLGAGTHKRLSDRTLELWNIPYWSITIPLTLISVLLLLTKPRATNDMEAFAIKGT